MAGVPGRRGEPGSEPSQLFSSAGKRQAGSWPGTPSGREEDDWEVGEITWRNHGGNKSSPYSEGREKEEEELPTRQACRCGAGGWSGSGVGQCCLCRQHLPHSSFDIHFSKRLFATFPSP